MVNRPAQMLVGRHYWLKRDPDTLHLHRTDGSFVAAFSVRGVTAEALLRAVEEDRRGRPAYFGPEEHAASITRLVEARARSSWEKFLRMERRMLKARANGQLAKALALRLPLESQEELERMAKEDRKRAEEGLLELRSEQGDISYKQIDDLTPEDRTNRIRAELRRMEWLLERQTRRNAILRQTDFFEPRRSRR
jgi:hypothetical protein